MGHISSEEISSYFVGGIAEKLKVQRDA